MGNLKKEVLWFGSEKVNLYGEKKELGGLEK